MKTAILTLLLTIASTAFALAEPESPDLAKRLQQGLVEEEVNRDPTAAIEHYEKLLEDFDAGRQFAATALFRTAECHRKLGNEKAAAENFSRLVQLFPEQEKLVALARQNLTALGVAEQVAPSGGLELTQEESEMLKELSALVRNSPDVITGRDAEHLLVAIKNGYTEASRFLLKNGADPQQAGEGGSWEGRNALDLAIENGHLKIVEAILQTGAKPSPNQLLLAINKERKMIVSALVEHLQEHDPEFDFTAALRELIWRKENGHLILRETISPDAGGDEHFIEKIESLLALGARPDAPDERGRSIFHLLAEHSVTKLSRYFLDKGVDVDLKTPSGMTALDFAADSQHSEMIVLLLERGADPNNISSGATWDPVADPFGTPEVAEPTPAEDERYREVTPLIRCALSPHRGIIGYRELLEGGASINYQDGHGNTAVHYAAQRNNDNGLSVLLAANADLTLKNKAGQTPLNLADPAASRHGVLRNHMLISGPGRAETLLVRGEDAAYPAASVVAKRDAPGAIAPTLVELLVEGRFGDVAPSDITIFRLGEAEPKHYDLIKLASGDQPEFPELKWGDLVELEPRQHLNSVGLGKIRDLLLPHAVRQVTVKRGDLEASFTVTPQLAGLPKSWGLYDLSTGIVRDVRTPLDLVTKAYLLTPSTTRSVAKLIRADGELMNISLMDGAKDQPELEDGDRLELAEAEFDRNNSHAITCDQRLLYWSSGIYLRECSLADLIGIAYSSRTPFVIRRPDFSKLSAHVVAEDGAVSIPAWDLTEIVEGSALPGFGEGGVRLNIPLAAGAEGGEAWTGLAPAIVTWLEEHLAYSVEIHALDQPVRPLRIGPEIFSYRESDGYAVREELESGGEDRFDARGIESERLLGNAGYTDGKLYDFEGTSVTDKSGSRGYGRRAWLWDGAVIEISGPPRRPVAVPAAAIKARLEAQARDKAAAGSKSRTSGRRVVLPPKSR